MAKEIKDYLHLYLGCEVMWTRLSEKQILTEKVLQDVSEYPDSKFVIPILRPLSDITKEEKIERDSLMTKRTDGVHAVEFLTPNVYSFKYLLDKHFDLFGLIESGLAIDKTTLNGVG